MEINLIKDHSGSKGITLIEVPKEESIESSEGRI